MGNEPYRPFRLLRSSVHERPLHAEGLRITRVLLVAGDVAVPGIPRVAQVPERGEADDLECQICLGKSQSVEHEDLAGAGLAGVARAPRLHGDLDFEVEGAAPERAPELGSERDG